MSQKKEYTLAEIAEFTGSQIVGNSLAVVNNIATLENAKKDSISFLANKKYHKIILKLKKYLLHIGVEYLLT